MAELFNEEIISQATHTKWAGKTVHFAKETDSTNSWIKRLAKDGAEHGRKKERDMVSFLWQSISLQAADVSQDDGVHRQTVPSP